MSTNATILLIQGSYRIGNVILHPFAVHIPGDENTVVFDYPRVYPKGN